MRSCGMLVQRSAPTCLECCLAWCPYARHVAPHIRLTQRHSLTCSCGEPMGFLAACYRVSWRYARDVKLRLECRSF